ncbi:hypothetical protein ZYGR_0S02460 [Zygosaccharomyces rouxii]|uniref:ZYRO0F08008p n=2 Tax=Zygosaccharomyces rouxii TaxID=4956 RepID=C5DXV1_ZYGRC|nr:uncharacterized protein ZYRO0F08008g [Zygosaccharomyces rouxii]KAH9199370.1 hypothetical protein LQ764DRAFT_129416 [Zygosaccharomyces rouxii]GAV50112.1 hypothetical protein ZYGR_0S02460 [Zygosaccharomyces rouxii]CAR28612.1 ZYRO0F08008p [Zygosaccharomyces rouxii]
MSEAPEFIRVKRRRDEDSVQALLVDEGQKKRKKGRFIFKLARTVNSDSYENADEALTPLLKLAANDHRHFVLEREGKRRRDSDDVEQVPPVGKPAKVSHLEDHQKEADDLPPEINQMVSDILNLNKNDKGEQNRPRKPSKKHFGGSNREVVSLPSNDYIYDIYHLESLKDDDLNSYKYEDLGFVKIVNKFIDLVPDEDTDPEQCSDDEDSNEENYYQNDYPDDEDDDRSIPLGSEADEESLPEEITWKKQPQDDYAELFDKLGQSDNILDSLNTSNLVNLDADDDDDDEDWHEDLDDEEFENDNYDGRNGYKANEFFPTDKDDSLAAHRDKIFGRLEKLLNKG